MSTNTQTILATQSPWRPYPDIDLSHAIQLKITSKGGDGEAGGATGGGGGGGGGYGQWNTVTLIERSQCSIHIGSGTNEFSAFVDENNESRLVVNGEDGSANPGLGGGGGDDGTSGDINSDSGHAGGHGGRIGTTGGGGGGEAGSASAAGNNGSDGAVGVGGAGGTGTAGANGGAGGNVGVNGVAGVAYGGGGGGAGSAHIGGVGGAAKIEIIYTQKLNLFAIEVPSQDVHPNSPTPEDLYAGLGVIRSVSLPSGTYNASNHATFDAGDQTAITNWLADTDNKCPADFDGLIMLDDESYHEQHLPGSIAVMESIRAYVQAARPLSSIGWYGIIGEYLVGTDITSGYFNHAAAAAHADACAALFANVDCILPSIYDNYRLGDDTDGSIDDDAWIQFLVDEAIDAAGEKPVFAVMTGRYHGGNAGYGSRRMTDTELRSDLRTALDRSHTSKTIKGIVYWSADLYYCDFGATPIPTRIKAEIPHGKTLAQHLVGIHTHWIKMMADEVFGTTYNGFYPGDVDSPPLSDHITPPGVDVG